MWRVFVVIAIVVWLTPTQEASLALTWPTPHALRVSWASPGWHCVYLIGGYLPEKSVGCANDATQFLPLPAGNVDYLEAPQLRSVIELRDTHGNVVARQAIPPRYTYWLPTIDVP